MTYDADSKVLKDNIMAGNGIPQRGRPAKPLSIEQVAARAQSFDYNPNIALRHWLRSAGTLLKEVMY